MLSKTNDGTKRIEKYLLENSATPEVKPIPKTEKKPTPKNDETNTYDYNDDPNADDKEW